MSLISESDVSNWHAEADLVVCGFGMAGACAGLGALEHGAEVLVLERGSGINGATTMATGHFYLGGGTRTQLANGIDDSPEAMYRYLMALTPEPEEEKIRLYADHSVEHYNWLLDQGVVFNDGYYRTKAVEQPTAECLIWSGNEKVWPYSEQAQPAPRGHKIENEGSGGGAIAMQAMAAKAERLGAKFEFDARVDALVTNAAGDVIGVRYRQFSETFFVRARRGVVLATGGWVMNKAMVQEHIPYFLHPRVWPQGGSNDDGSGITLGEAAGGCAIRMERFFITSPIYPPESLLKGIAVNKYGKRFINEDSYHARFAKACLDQDDGIAYLIIDNTHFARPELNLQELIDAWETVEEMEADLKLPEGSLQETLAAYNDSAENGEDPAQHKYKDWLAPLTEAPFAALQLSRDHTTYTGFTLGGLKVSADAEVLSAKGEVIGGLYAAGACASNIAQDSNGYSSGTCLGEASFFGRRAGHHAMGLGND